MGKENGNYHFGFRRLRYQTWIRTSNMEHEMETGLVQGHKGGMMKYLPNEALNQPQCML